MFRLVSKATWVKQEQYHSIEWKFLEPWGTAKVSDALCNIWKRVLELEADQNQYISKPHARDMSLLQPEVK